MTATWVLPVTEETLERLRPEAEETLEASPPGPEALAPLAVLSGDVPALLLEVVAAAVDPLEIAACLETCGLSNAVVKNRFGHNDVFGLAQQLYRSAEFQAAPAADRRADIPTAVRFFVHGVCCGLFVALFMVLEPAQGKPSSWPAAAAYPMVLSLGVMEWQLRSLRAGGRAMLLRSYTVAGFGLAVRKKLAHSTSCYLSALVGLTALVQALAYARGVAVPVPLLVAGACLATAFFLALVVSSCGRIDLVLGAWTAGLATFGAWALLAKVVHPSLSLPGADAAFCGAALVSATVLALAARRTVVNPFCHA
jgi:hypothetical protein